MISVPPAIVPIDILYPVAPEIEVQLMVGSIGTPVAAVLGAVTDGHPIFRVVKELSLHAVLFPILLVGVTLA